MTKQCRKCSQIKDYAYFDKHSGCVGGVAGMCKACRKLYQKENRDRDNAQRRKNYALNPFKILARNKIYAEEHASEIAQYLKDYARENREYLRNYHREYSVEWRNENRGFVNAKAAGYRATKLQQTPLWLTEEQRLVIEKIYELCPNGYEVDHIIPLQGENVRGLHVPWNLQYLPMHVNRSKSNKIKYSQE